MDLIPDNLLWITRSWSKLYHYRRRIRKRFPDFWNLVIKKNYFQVTKEEVTDGRRVLDVGSSDRALGKKLKEYYPHIVYKSMDIDREQYHNFYDIADIEEKFDFVFLIEVIEHVEFEEGVKLLYQLHNALIPGGKLILTTPNLYHPNRYWEYSHRVSYRYDEIGGVLEALGYKVKNIYRIYNDAFFQRIFRIYVASCLHRFLSVDFAKSILIVAEK